MLLHPLQVIFRGVPAEKDRREGDEGRQQPHVGQHKAHRAHCHVQGVFQGPYYSVVPAARTMGETGREESDSIRSGRTNQSGETATHLSTEMQQRWRMLAVEK